MIGKQLLAAAITTLDKPQAGFYRLKIGAVSVLALCDGTLAFPADDLLLNAEPGEMHRLLNDAFDPAPFASVSAYLIFLGGQVILIDTGGETLLGPTLGKLPASLKAAGVEPSDISDVFLTHAHPDHEGGLMVGSRTAFPRAVIHLEKADLDYWLSPSAVASAPDLLEPFFAQAEPKLRPYLRDGQVKPFHGVTQFFPGFSARPTPGHTPWHTCYVLENGGQKLVFMGDTTHVMNIQFTTPELQSSSTLVLHKPSRQMERAGARMTSWLQVLLELQRDWTRHETYDGARAIIHPA